MIVSVVRHGETDWNREGRYQGQLESHLTATGSAQAEALSRSLRDERIGRIISSPLARCLESARPLAAAHMLPIETDSRLIEIAHGTWEGRLRDEIEHDEPELMRAWRGEPDRVQFQGGESLADVLARWRSFAESISGNDDIVVFTHDVVVRIAILEATGRTMAQLWQPRVVNGGYARFNVRGGAWALLDECVEAHLDGFRVDIAHQAL